MKPNTPVRTSFSHPLLKEGADHGVDWRTVASYLKMSRAQLRLAITEREALYARHVAYPAPVDVLDWIAATNGWMSRLLQAREDGSVVGKGDLK